MNKNMKTMSPMRNHCLMLALAAVWGLAPGQAVAQTNSCVASGVSSGLPLTCTPAAGDTDVVDIDSPLLGLLPFNATGSEVSVIVGNGDGHIEVHNYAGIQGGFDFSALGGHATVYNYAPDATQPDTFGLSMIGDAIVFGGGDDVLHNMAGAQIISGAPDGYIGRDGVLPNALVRSSIDFGDGEDRWINEGALVVGVTTVEETFRNWPRAFQMDVLNLEHFDNSGRIILGGVLAADTRLAIVDRDQVCTSGPCMATHGRTDGEFSTVLAMPGTHYTGLAGSQLIIDAVFGLGHAQRNCVDRADQAGRFRLPGADCLDLSGGSTDGVTEVVVSERFAQDAGAYNPEGMVVVDVSGGSSAAGHFVLSAESDRYNAAIGGIDKGMFYFPLVYDAERQQHKLVGLPSHRAYQMPLLIQSAQAINRSFASGWQDRQSERRGSEAGGDNAVWGRITQANVSRDVRQSVGPRPFANDFDLDTTAVQLGVDWLRGRADDSAWTLGAMFGYANARADFELSGSRADFDGVMLGAYASYEQGAFYWDALLSGSWLQIDYDDATLSDPTDPFAVLKVQGSNLGVEAEAGYRITREALQIEPLLAVSWVRTDFDEMTVFSGNPSSRPGNTVFGGHAPSSLRAALGARASMSQALGDLQLSYRFTARVWNELQGDTKVLLRSQGPDVTVRDDFDGTLTEINLGVGLENASRSLSGSLQLNAGFGDGYDSLGVSAGFRYQW